MKEGIFIKVLFAYEVKYVDSYYLSWFDIKEKWAYRNVVEETVFYICNSSVNVLFQNIVFSDSSNENKIVADTERTELIRTAGTIKSGDATIEGFKINTLGNNYKVKYKFNLSSNWKLAQNGQIFTSPGRYDFRVTSQIGNFKETTIYINERGEQQNIKKYFADGFITKESHRIFTSNATPTYVAGKTYYKINAVNKNFIGLVGKIKIIKGQDITPIDENDPLYDTEKGGEQYKVTDIIEEVAVLTESTCRNDWSGILTEPGEYIAEFANNPRYFENDFSGDVYHFVFKFTLTNDEPTPNLNETLLSTNLCYFDYDPEYFGVTLNSKGQGKVTYAFSYYTDAQSFAYNYYLSQVKFENSKYIFQNKEYSSNSDVLREVYILSEDSVELRYFDPTDESTLLTIQNAQTEILNLNLQRDVVVMSDMLMPHDSATGVAFLNNKKYYYTDEDGNITKDETPVRFISIADFESNSIKLVHIESKTSINVDYGTPVETLLYHNRMPSGLYKIIETNINGYENVYYANYISKGDLQVYLTISVFDEKLDPEISLSKSQANNRYTVNNFTLKSATNNLDNYGLIKLRKLGNTGYTKMFTLTEIENYEVKEKGSYEITLIDRIGNFAKIYIDINNAADIHNLTLVDDETNVNETKRVSVGQTIKLETLTSENSLIENIGWQDKNGNVYVNEYTFNGDTDTILNAVWQYKNTNINVYDGENILNKISRPDETVVLPEIKVLDSSLKLYGFAYKLEDNSYIFYRGQITKVPNVESMTLNAYYVDYAQTYTNNLQSKMNMEFVGWLLETEKLKGYILTDDEVTDNMTVYALWKKTETMLVPDMFFAGSIITSVISFTLLLMYNLLEMIRQRKQVLSPVKQKVTKEKVKIKTVKQSRPERVRTKFNLFAKIKKLKLITIISCVLCLIFVFQPFSNILFNVAEKSRYDAKVESIKQQIESTLNIDNSPKSPDSHYMTVVAESMEQFAMAAESLENTETVNNLTDDELFLQALIILDLVDLGYTVFPVYANKTDGTMIKGFGYTDYEEFYTKENDDNLYIGTGFIPLINEQQITETDVENVVELSVVTDEAEEPENNKYILTFEETFNSHYVAYDKYITYTVKDFKVEYTTKDNSFENYNLELGYLFDYDNESPIYDPELNSQTVFKSEAFSIVQGVDYNFTYNTSVSMINDQNNNFLTVDTMQIFYISREALNEFIIHNQEESYLGIPTDEIQKLESQLDNTVFYYVDENGELQLAQIPADPERNIFKTIMAVAQITIGAILIVTCAGALAGAGMIVSGTVSLLSDELSQIMSGLGTISTGLNCIMVGLTCFTCPWGAVLGVIDIVVGAATVAVGMNDIATAVTGRNFIRELTGMSEQAYFWMSLGLNIASSALTIASTALRDAGKLCFVAGTGVLVVGANGILMTKNIEDIKVGDRVMTYNEQTGYNEVKTVLETYKSEHTELVSVTTTDGQTIKSSLGHRYFTNRGWISAENLRAGDILQNVNGEQVIVEFIQHEILENPETLYNFAVDDNHNYYVSEDKDSKIVNFVLAHNKCYRQRLAEATGGDPGKDYHAHHQIPKKIAKKYGFKDMIDINDPKYMEWMESSKHLHGAYKYNKLWENALEGRKDISKEIIETIWESLKNQY